MNGANVLYNSLIRPFFLGVNKDMDGSVAKAVAAGIEFEKSDFSVSPRVNLRGQCIVSVTFVVETCFNRYLLRQN